MILLEMIVQVAARPVDDPLAEVGLEGAGTGIMTLTRCGVILATACAEAKTASAAA